MQLHSSSTIMTEKPLSNDYINCHSIDKININLSVQSDMATCWDSQTCVPPHVWGGFLMNMWSLRVKVIVCSVVPGSAGSYRYTLWLNLCIRALYTHPGEHYIHAAIIGANWVKNYDAILVLHRWVKFRTVTLVYKSLNGLTPI